MANENIHVVAHERGWAVKRQGVSEPVSVHSSKSEAVAAGVDVAAEKEVDLVIHRRNGTFEEVRRAEELEPNGRSKSSDSGTREHVVMGMTAQGPSVQARDMMSVGTRVAWSAIAAGLIVSFVSMLVMLVVGTAVGASLVALFNIESADLMANTAILWGIVTLLVSLFLGGFVTSRSVAGEDCAEAAKHGVLLWGTAMLLAPYLMVANVNLGFGMIRDTAETAQVASNLAAQAEENAPAEARERIDQAQGEVQEATREAANNLPANLDNAAENAKAALNQAGEEVRETVRAAGGPLGVAWWTVAGLVVSLAAAISGAMVGAGPEFVVHQATFRHR